MNSRIFLPFALIVLLTCMLHNSAFAEKKKKKAERPLTIYEIDTLVQKIPKNREFFHTRINAEQRKADSNDGTVDGKIYYGEDSTLSAMLTQAMMKDVDHLQIMVENLPNDDDQTKKRYLTAVWNLVRRFNRDVRVDPIYYKRLVANERDMIIARHENKLPDFVKKNINIYTMDNYELLDGYPDLKALVFTEIGKQDPKMMIKRLGEFANEPFAPQIVAAAARVVPDQVYNYASSTNVAMKGAVMRSTDPLVQTIVQIAQQSKDALKALPFLNDIYSKRKTIAQIDEITSNPDLFYKNLVRLKVENDSLGGATYTDELQYRGLDYIRTVNNLHESPPNVRFKSIETFDPAELYFLMVYGQDEIYTSSFVGTFNRMMERMKPIPGDQLFDKVHYDHFRTFIRMCADITPLVSSCQL